MSCAPPVWKSSSLLYIISRYFVMKQEITIGIVMIVKRHHYTEKNGPLLRISTAVCVCIIWPQHQEQKKRNIHNFQWMSRTGGRCIRRKKKRESVVSATADAGIIIIIIIIIRAPPYIYYECNIERKFDRICTEKKNMKDLLFLAS